MKRALKIGLISVGSLAGAIIVAAAILLFHIFSPSRLAEIVNSQADRLVTCDFHIDKAGLTVFKTFPKIGLDIENVVLKNPTSSQVPDTLLYARGCVAALNIRELLKNNRIEIHDFALNHGVVNLFIDENGNGNYDVFKSDPDDTSSFNYKIDLQKVKVNDVDVHYLNLQSRQKADVLDANLTARGTFEANSVDGQAELAAKSLAFTMADSTPLHLTTGNIDLSYDGSFTNFNLLDGKLDADIRGAALRIDTTHYLSGTDLTVTSDVNADLGALRFSLQDTKLSLDNQELAMKGSIHIDTASSDIHTDLHYRTGDWKIGEVLPMIPRSFIGNSLDDIQIDGHISLEGDVRGTYSDTQTPVVTTGVALRHGRFAMKDLPLPFDDIDGLFDLNIDLDDQTDLTVKSLSAITKSRNRITASGTVKNLLGKMLLDIVATGNLHMDDFRDLLPEDFTECKGKADISVKTRMSYDPAIGFSVNNIDEADIKGQFGGLELLYHDTLRIRSSDLYIDLDFPVAERPYKIGEWLHAKVSTPALMLFSLPQKASVTTTASQLDVYTNNLTDSTIQLKMAAAYQFGDVAVSMDTLNVRLDAPQGVFVMHNADRMRLDYTGGAVTGNLGGTNFYAKTLKLNGETDFHDGEENILLNWSPKVKMQLSGATVNFAGVEQQLAVPDLDIDFNTQKCVLKKANIGFGESNASITGVITGIEPYLRDRGLLKGSFDLNAGYLNLNQLADLVSGLNAPDSLAEQAAELAGQNGDSPFIVPFGVDVNVSTTIRKALYEDAEFRNIAGRVYVKDGVLVLEEMGLTNDAARMQLTAMYRTPRMNHLFLGFDFHLLDIKIDKLIAMIPEVDTILPMLKAFSGNAEFHFAAETYLKSNYDLKFSTLRGAAAINGHDLVVLDNETYKNIAKKLMFSKKTQNKIDSLSTEITIFRNEVDVYPFLLSIDKYSAIISGRHNLDMTYDYNISLLKPLRIGLDIIGLEDKLKFKVGKARYATLFVPEKRKVVESNVLELKTLINRTLQENVKNAEDAVR